MIYYCLHEKEGFDEKYPWLTIIDLSLVSDHVEDGLNETPFVNTFEKQFLFYQLEHYGEMTFMIYEKHLNKYGDISYIVPKISEVVKHLNKYPTNWTEGDWKHYYTDHVDYNYYVIDINDIFI